MSGYVETEDDNGGVHINSGIPNRAFYLTAAEIGGNAYDDPGKIWYTTLTSGTFPGSATFADFAEATRAAARDLFGEDSTQLAAVTKAWQTVGVLSTDEPPQPEPPSAESEDLMRAAKTALGPSNAPAPPPTPDKATASTDRGAYASTVDETA